MPCGSRTVGIWIHLARFSHLFSCPPICTPQTPVLFSDTFAFNLDPMGRHTPEELETALRKAHVFEFVQRLGGLEAG